MLTRRRIGLSALMMLVFANLAHGQQAPTTFPPHPLPWNAEHVVKEARPARTVQPRFSTARIAAIDEKPRRHTMEGAVLGFMAGAVFGGFLALAHHEDRPGGPSQGASVTVGAITWAVPGALIGAALGSLK